MFINTREYATVRKTRVRVCESASVRRVCECAMSVRVCDECVRVCDECASVRVCECTATATSGVMDQRTTI
eukprot:scaffold556_cov62-Phaeocystis_antarctica.AAC.3